MFFQQFDNPPNQINMICFIGTDQDSIQIHNNDFQLVNQDFVDVILEAN